MIRITAKTEGFRRCGSAHSKEPTEYPDDQFSKKELAILKSEPMLVVQEIASADKQERPNVKDSVKLVEAAESGEALDKLAEGEDRKGVLDAIEKRRKELAPKE